MAALPVISLALCVLGTALVAIGGFQPWFDFFTPDGFDRWLPIVLAVAALVLAASGAGGNRRWSVWATTPAFAVAVIAVTWIFRFEGWSVGLSWVGRGLWMVLAGGVILTAGSIIGQIRPEELHEPADNLVRRAA